MRFTERLDKIADFNDLNGVQADRWLVQDNDLRVSQQRLRNADALTIALGECADQTVAHSLNAGALGNLVDLCTQRLAAQALCRTDKFQILLRRLIHIEGRLLWEIADQLFGRLRLLQNVKAADLHGAVCRGKASRHHVHRGRFPRAVWPQKAVDMTVLNFKG